MKNLCILAKDVDRIEVYQDGYLAYEVWRNESGEPIFKGRITFPRGTVTENRIFYKDGRTETAYQKHK